MLPNCDDCNCPGAAEDGRLLGMAVPVPLMRRLFTSSSDSGYPKIRRKDPRGTLRWLLDPEDIPT